MRRLREGITLLVVARDEERRIGNVLSAFRPYVDEIIVVEDGSKDRTVEEAEEYTDLIVHPEKIDCLHAEDDWVSGKWGDKVHSCSVYNAGQKKVETVWTLSSDCDEVWDPAFVENIKFLIEKFPVAPCFRFPRVNLPTGENYPDYQVRLLKTQWADWKHTPHVIPFFVGEREKEGGEKLETPIDAVEGVKTFDQNPIIHLPRRNDLKRQWWGYKL